MLKFLPFFWWNLGQWCNILYFQPLLKGLMLWERLSLKKSQQFTDLEVILVLEQS